MALRSFLLLFLLLSSSYLVSLNAIPISRFNKLSTKAGVTFVSETMKQSKVTNEDGKIEKGRIEGRMDIEQNDYEPVQPNPVHTPTPPPTS
ncbi:hypothetical protein KSS87_016924 [Heliosperma pusillum]|nr:hypothetical protein KSS87_016924 [Heliosperma pusillum]